MTKKQTIALAAISIILSAPTVKSTAINRVADRFDIDAATTSKLTADIMAARAAALADMENED